MSRRRGRGFRRGGGFRRGRGGGRGRRGGRGRKRGVANNNILPESLHKFLLDNKGVGFVDTHCHFNLFYQRLVPRNLQNTEKKLDVLKNVLFTQKEEIRKNIFEHLDFVIQVYCDPVSFSPSLSLYRDLCIEDRDFGNYCAFGCHPHEAKSYNDAIEKNILECVKYERCVAFGEIGLDFHYNFSPRDVQLKVFRRQLELAKKVGKPIIIHSREAEEETVQIMKELVDRETNIHVHCYTSPYNQYAKDMIKHFPNCYIGFTGILTYPSFSNKKEIKDLVDLLPLNRILLESDGPYLPVRDREYLKGGNITSTCCNIPFIGKKLAEMKKIDYRKLMEQVNINSRNMYNIK